LPLNLGGVGRTAGPPLVGGGIPSEEIQISDFLVSRVIYRSKTRGRSMIIVWKMVVDF